MELQLENIKLEHEKAALVLSVDQLNERVLMLQRIVNQLQHERMLLCTSLYEYGLLLMGDCTLKTKSE